MMSPSSAQATRRVPAGIAALIVACAWFFATALPASARPTDYALVSPKDKATLVEPVEIVAWVDRTMPAPSEAPGPQETTELLSRLKDAKGKQIGTDKLLENTKITNSADAPSQRLEFRGVLDPYALVWTKEPTVAANGTYILEVQWRTRYGESFEEMADQPRAVTLKLNVPPPVTAVNAALTDAEAKRIDVAWAAVDVPDLLGYRLEVSRNGAAWKDSRLKLGPAATTAAFKGLSAGRYRYRVVARRAAADKGELTSVSKPTTTVLVADDSEPPGDDDDPGSDTGDSGDSGDDNGTGSGFPATGSGTVMPPSPPPAPSLVPGTPQGSLGPTIQAPANANEQYDPLIDYGVDIPTEERTERVAIDVPVDEPADSFIPVTGSGGIDTQRVLPAMAGGLVLLLSAAHVIRFLNA